MQRSQAGVALMRSHLQQHNSNVAVCFDASHFQGIFIPCLATAKVMGTVPRGALSVKPRIRRRHVTPAGRKGRPPERWASDG